MAKQETLMKVIDETQRIEVTYAWTPDVLKLKENIGQAITVQRSVERRLIKKGELDLYNQELQKALDTGVLVRLGPKDLEYPGPVSYVTHHPVYKQGSKTTPIRIVSNSSFKNKTCKLSPNECMATPPNALSDLLTVLLRWRTYPVALILDLTRAYQSIKTGEMERHVRRIVWRWGIPENEWEILAYDCMTFGDQLAALCLELAKKIAAEKGQEIDSEAALLLVESCYVDDLLGGGTEDQVRRFMGTRWSDGTYSGTLSAILSTVGLSHKALIRSGESDPEILADFNHRVLGLGWIPETDVIVFNFPINLSSKYKTGERIESDLEEKDIPRLPSITMTKRRLLSWINSVYDPTGILAPMTIKLKIAYRRLVAKEFGELDWDQHLPQEAHQMWEQLIAEFIQLEDIVIPRSTRPKTAVGSPEVFGFFDGSLDAYGCCIYVRWQLQESDTDEMSYQVRLIAGKARVTSIHGSTAPRSELSSLLVLSRLLLVVLRAMWEKPAQVILSGDSQCTIAALEKSGGLLRVVQQPVS